MARGDTTRAEIESERVYMVGQPPLDFEDVTETDASQGLYHIVQESRVIRFPIDHLHFVQEVVVTEPKP